MLKTSRSGLESPLVSILREFFLVEVISSSANLPFLLPEIDGININFCKNPYCCNFGVPAEIVKFRRKHGSQLKCLLSTLNSTGQCNKLTELLSWRLVV